MKISIQQEDITSYVEFEDFDIYEFANHLRNLLYSVWYPEQVIDIMPTEDSLRNDFEQARKEAYDEGYAEGEAANAKSAETTDDLRDCIREGKANIETSKTIVKEGEREQVEGYEAGYSEGYATAVAAMQETYEPLLKATAKDIERLDWVIDKTSIWIPRKDKDGEEWWVELDYSEPRLDIDKEMQESE